MAVFELVQKDKNSRARAGILETAHGIVETPSYVIVGTNAKVRCLELSDIPLTKTQIIIANTYHLWRELGESLENFVGLHKRTGWEVPIMTDSGGFQVFSLGFAREHRVGKIIPDLGESLKEVRQPEKNLVRVTEDGVYFLENGEEIFLDAKKSIQIQEKLGADIILAFDECTSPLNDYKYTKRAMERTHKWAKKCLEVKSRKDQQLFGIVQGGLFEDLRKESAKFIGNLPFDGFAIGGAFSSEGAFQAIDWITPYLPEEKPRHLLGMGKIQDIFGAVARGIDTFDCVIPTREARHGGLWTRESRLSIKRGIYKKDRKKIDRDCGCPVCADWKINRSELHAMFKTKEPNAARFATIHNVYFFNNLMADIRRAILDGNFSDFSKKFLAI